MTFLFCHREECWRRGDLTFLIVIARHKVPWQSLASPIKQAGRLIKPACPGYRLTSQFIAHPSFRPEANRSYCRRYRVYPSVCCPTVRYHCSRDRTYRFWDRRRLFRRCHLRPSLRRRGGTSLRINSEGLCDSSEIVRLCYGYRDVLQ